MEKQVYEIDEKGYIVKIHVVEFDEEGQPVEHLAENIITINPPDGLYRARWINGDWISTITEQEYILSLNNQPKEPTEIELLKIKLQKAEELATENSLNQQQLLELLLELGVL